MGLNEKLGEWVGFEPKGSGYVWPDGKFGKLPPFTTSLDALYQWIVPRLNQVQLRDTNRFEGEWQKAYRAMVKPPRQQMIYGPTGLDPAMALALAFEKLIDAGVTLRATGNNLPKGEHQK